VRATRDQRDRLLADFGRYCEIESPSRRERPMTDAVAADLRAMGLEVVEDATQDDTGSNAGNILARIAGPEGAEQGSAEPGDGAPTILLCAHLDTVPLDAPIDIERDEEGWIRNRNDAILGADNKAAVAVIMETARHLTANGAPVGVELLFTVCEELALLGASAFDQDQLKAEFGFVFDHATPIGEIIIAAPTYYQLDVTFHGKAAHAGMRPEDGHNAIAAAAAGLSALEFGRLDKQTTANVGVIKGGNQGNVVPDRCDMILETRSLDHERAFTHAQHMVDELTAAASDHQCDVDIDLQELFRGYKLARTAPQVEAAARALEANRIEPVYINTGGGSDANAFILGGLPCVNMANGTVNPHQHDEAVTVQALETMLDVVLTLVEECAR
jgi:tripeptide aminopeptidase